VTQFPPCFEFEEKHCSTLWTKIGEAFCCLRQ